MNAFDAAGLTFFNQFAFRWPAFDGAVAVLSQFYLFKGVLLMSLLWWVWFQPGPEQQRRREIAMMAILGGLLALATARLMVNVLPFRNRPVYNPALPLHYPQGDPTQYLEDWSAFPSDHAMLWFAIAVGIFLASRRVGIIAILYAAIFICLPRIYLGLHHPTDILAGAARGAVLVIIAATEPVRRYIARPILKWSDRHPPSFYMAAFLSTYFLATHFYEIKFVVIATRHILKH
ncbi:MAG: phosphatase PAP2 family protein [Burkholderiaceae bacterium]